MSDPPTNEPPKATNEPPPGYMKPEDRDNSEFSINSFFNNLPIRVIGTPDNPFIYAADLADVLGLKGSFRRVINKFDDIDIVSPAERSRYNLKTYRMEKRGKIASDNIILLKEAGAYRLIIHSKKEIARDFRIHISNLIHESRIKEKEKLVITNQDDFVKLKIQYENLQTELREYKRETPILYVFGITRDEKFNTREYIKNEEIDSDDFHIFTRVLTKYTYAPTATDYTQFNLFAKIYGYTKNIFMGYLQSDEDTICVAYEVSEIMAFNTSDEIIPEFDECKISYCS